MSRYSYFTDPSQEFFLDQERKKRESSQRQFEQLATDPYLLSNLAQFATNYPTSSAELGLAVARGGIPASDPSVQKMVTDELSTREVLGPISESGGGWWNSLANTWDEAVDNTVKGASRWGFGLWDATYQMIAGGAPIRANQLAQQEGISFFDAWKQQDPYIFEALGSVIAGQETNLGSGWMPNSDVAEDVQMNVNAGMEQVERDTAHLDANEKYTQRLEASPGIWRDSVSNSLEQQQMGDPLTQMNYADTESVMFDIDSFSGNKVRTPWSLGRVAAANFVEPGTSPFGKISGVGDFGAQVFLDPIDWVGGAWAKAGISGRKIWATGRAASVTPETAIARNLVSEPAGLPAPPKTLALGTGEPSPLARALTGDEMGPPTVQYTTRRVVGVDDEGFNIIDDVVEEFPAALPGRPAYQVAEEGKKIPWWLSPVESAKRTLSAIDPPDWFIDMHQRTRQGAAGGGGVKRSMAGLYKVDLPRLPGGRAQELRITRRGKGKNAYWDVTRPDGTKVREAVDDPRFTQTQGTEQFGTLAEAKRIAGEEVARYGDEDLRVHGMTADEFIDSGEDFVVDEYQSLARSSNPTGPDSESVLHGARKRVPEDATNGRNANVRVFGKSVDLSDGKVPDTVPKQLRDALDADGRLDIDNVVGFGDPYLERWDSTMAWMEANGVGKLNLPDGKVLVHDRFVGGNSRDQLGRMWFTDQNGPIHTMSQGDELLTGPTPAEINKVVDDIDELAQSRVPEGVGGPGVVTDTGGIQGEGFGIPGMPEPHPGVVGAQDDVASALRQADIENAAEVTVDSVRPDFDPGYQLHGKKADAFIDRLAAASAAYKGGKDGSLLDNLLRFLSRQNTPVPTKVRQAILDADNKEDIRRIFSEWLVKEGGQEVLLPGGLQYGRMAAGITPTNRPVGVAAKIPTGFRRRFATSISGRERNMLDDPDGAYALFDSALPHYNVKRGGQVQKYDADGKILEGQFIDVEELFQRLRNLVPGAKQQAFDLMGDYSSMFFSSLVGDGVDPRLAERSAVWWRDSGGKSVFDSERLGRIDLSAGPGDKTLINDVQIGGMGPQVTADMWGGALQPVSPRDMKRISNESDTLGKISNRIALKKYVDDAGGMEFHERASIRALDYTIQKVWKPLVLLRGAWTLRILMDDQMRMAAEGYSALNHPARIFNYALSNPKDWRDAFLKGNIDVHGVKMSVDNVDEMKHAELFVDALMKKRGANSGVGGYGNQVHTIAGKGTPGYIDGMVFELTHLNGSPMTQRLANSKSDDPVDEVVRWLQGAGGDEGNTAARSELMNQAGLVEGMGGDEAADMASRVLAGEREALEMVVNRQYGLLHHKTGGLVYMDTGKGEYLDYGNLKLVANETPNPTGEARWVVIKEGDEDLLEVVRGGRERDIGGLNTEESIKKLKELVTPKVRASEYFPPTIRVPKTQAEMGKTEGLSAELDKAISGMFDWLMTKPSNYFSRVPEFQRAYWQKVADLYPYMDDALKKQIDEVARGARANDLLKQARKDKRGASIQGQLTDLDQVDAHAKAYGLTNVERTLFNLTEDKTNIADSLRLVFPFVEAWGEFITRWSRLMLTGDKNVKNLNRLRQTVQGARRSGFFQENDFGQEVFNYPAFMTKGQVGLHNKLNDIPGLGGFMGDDVSQEVAGAIEATGNVESLNFASTIIPGFGPVFQMAAKALPENPDYDWIRDIVAPFGTEGRIGTDMMPAWFKRVVTAQGGGDDPQLQYAYNSAVIDVIRTKIDSGDFAGVRDQTEVNELIREAEAEARGLVMVRAAATFWNPASPTYKFQKEDVDGLIWSYNNLGGAYYDMLEEAGRDEALAGDMFYERFGLLPHAFSGGKTYSTVDRSRYVEGNKFERSVPALFEEYPATAMYLDPNIGATPEYDHGATINQLQNGERESYSGEQFVYLQQDQLGDLWWDNINKSAALIEHTPTKKAYLAGFKVQVQEAYPFWNKPVPGKVPTTSNDVQMAEVESWVNNSQLAHLDVVQASQLYLMERADVLERIKRAGASTISGASSPNSDAGQVSTILRGYLRDMGAQLTSEYPEFGPLFDNVFSYEVSITHDEPQAPEELVAMFGADDGFQNLGVADG